MPDCLQPSDGLNQNTPPMECFAWGPLMTHLTPHDFLRQSLRQRQQSAANLAVRQCLLEPRDAFVADLGAAEAQKFQVPEFFQFLEARVRDPSVAVSVTSSAYCLRWRICDDWACWARSSAFARGECEGLAAAFAGGPFAIGFRRRFGDASLKPTLGMSRQPTVGKQGVQ